MKELELENIDEISTKDHTYTNIEAIEIREMPVTGIPFLLLIFDGAAYDTDPVAVRIDQVTGVKYYFPDES